MKPLKLLIKFLLVTIALAWLIAVFGFSLILGYAIYKEQGLIWAIVFPLITFIFLSCPVWFCSTFLWTINKIENDSKNQQALSDRAKENINEAAQNLTVNDFFFNIRGAYIDWLIFLKTWKYELLGFTLITGYFFLDFVFSIFIRH